MNDMTAAQDVNLVDTVDIFIEAVRMNELEKVTEMLDADPELANARSESGDSAILLALHGGSDAITELLLARGARLSIFEAAAVGNLDRVKEHLSIDPRLLNSVSHDGWTPLHLSSFLGRTNVVEYLAAIGADLHAVSKNGVGAMPIHSALAGRKFDVAQFLLEQGIDANARQSTLGYTPLHYAAANGLDTAVQKLLDFGAEAHLKSIDGKTPIELAAERNHSSVVRVLENLKEPGGIVQG